MTTSGTDNPRGVARLAALLAVGGLALGAPPAAASEDEDDIEPHAEAVTKLVIDREIEISYDYIALLMRLPNAFGEGAACVICHGSTDPKRSYRGLDLTNCGGIIRGATEPPVRPIVVPGRPGQGTLLRHLSRNRMPFGVAFDFPRDTDNIKTVRKWIDDGAKNDNFFNQDVLPLFAQSEAFGTSESCVFCHGSNDADSTRELDLTSYRGIMLGANVITNARDGLPPDKVIVPGDALASPLFQRLTENRMPAGIDPSERPDHPNTQILRRWIEQGARCN